jgi:hypothetical protein
MSLLGTSEIAVDRGADRREEGLLAKSREQPEALELVLDGILHLG